MEEKIDCSEIVFGVSGIITSLKPKHWYVAIVTHNTEKVCAEKLEKNGYEVYVPTQREVRQWKNGRRNLIDRVVISSIIFIRCTEQERRTEIVKFLFIKRFMMNRATAVGPTRSSQVAIIPEAQIEKLRFMLCNADSQVCIENLPLKLGDKVRVVRGKLMGLEGNIVQYKDGQSDIIVQLDILGCARMNISQDYLEKITS